MEILFLPSLILVEKVGCLPTHRKGYNHRPNAHLLLAYFNLCGKGWVSRVEYCKVRSSETTKQPNLIFCSKGWAPSFKGSAIRSAAPRRKEN
jgi:hypothetical protein